MKKLRILEDFVRAEWLSYSDWSEISHFFHFGLRSSRRDIFSRENFGETKLTKGNIEHALRQMVF